MTRAAPRAPDFIGIGAQRTGTSWIYSCLYEHPDLCLPRKEINFFSRERNWTRGFDWYEAIFAECVSGATAGEYSTSYLTHPEAPERIRQRYPDARLIVSLRHPVERAYSNYLNDIVAGVVPPSTKFEAALRSHPEYVENGRYAQPLRRYLDLFPREQVFVSLFDDARRDPLASVQAIYRFLDVDDSFRPAMLDRPGGTGRVPRARWVERWLIDAAAAFRRNRVLRPLWWRAKKIGLGDRLRTMNTAPEAGQAAEGLDPSERRSLIDAFEPEIEPLEELLGLDLSAWRV